MSHTSGLLQSAKFPVHKCYPENMTLCRQAGFTSLFKYPIYSCRPLVLSCPFHLHFCRGPYNLRNYHFTLDIFHNLQVKFLVYTALLSWTTTKSPQVHIPSQVAPFGKTGPTKCLNSPWGTRSLSFWLLSTTVPSFTKATAEASAVVLFR